ncbi:MAG: glycosyltransferase [Desulfobacterales bacterium]|nr:glycosyltransferase [Desulfobacterales bacterium]
MTTCSPLVSIVIPVYNGEDYISSAIESILQQDYPNLEIIVLDDGSNDNTQILLRQYDDRIYWESHRNMGQANTLNKGWAMAKGEFLSYLSADDLLMPKAVSTSVHCLQEHPEAVMAYCDFNLIDPESNIIRKVRPPDFDYRDMLVNIVCPPGPGVFFRKNAFELAGGWNSGFRQMPDYEYWLRLGLIGAFFHIPEVLASFRMHDQSQSFGRGDPQKSDEPIRIIAEYFREQEDVPESILASQAEAMANAHLVSSQLHWRSGRHRQSVSRMIEAIRIFPRVVLKKKIYKLILNALFHRFAHRLLWKVRRSSHLPLNV